MKKYFYTLLVTCGVLLLNQPKVSAAAPSRVPLTESPAETARKATATRRMAAKKTAANTKAATNKVRESRRKMRYAMMVMLGLAESKAVTTPVERQRQLHVHQQQLKSHVIKTSRARRARAHK